MNSPADIRIEINLARQSLQLWRGGEAVAAWPVSTAARGAGEENGSFKTPRGRHIVRAKIGAGAPAGAVFVGRRFTGEIFTPEMMQKEPRRDWILTRILWLSGCEAGKNRLGARDTMRRYIYIHGAPDSVAMGAPGSRGCIRMRNADITALFAQTPPYAAVRIAENG